MKTELKEQNSIAYEIKLLSIEKFKAKYFLRKAKDISVQKELELNIKHIDEKLEQLNDENKKIKNVAKASLTWAVIK